MRLRRWIIAAVILVVLVVAFFGLRSCGSQQAAVAGLADMQTVDAELGSLVATVGATGVVRANQTANLAWETSGTVDEVDVAVGDQVQAEQLLATLAQNSLPQSVILAQADLVNAQDALVDLNEAYDKLAVAQASQTLANAQDAVEEAQRRLDNLKAPAPKPDIDQAEANLILAGDRLDDAQDDFDPYENKPGSVEKARFQSALAQAQKDYDAALRLYNNLRGTPSATDLAIAEADLELAQEQLADAQEEYDRLAFGPTGDDIAAAEARVAAAEATLASAWIEAPFAGTITAVQPKTGDQVSPGEQAFRLDDLSRLLVDVEISEIDINRVEVGQSVSLTFDAILTREYSGTIVEVSPVGVSDQGVVNFTATLELDDADEQVKPGMTAGVNIVVNQLDDVLLVPNRAVRIVDGERVVFILQDAGGFESVSVELGASSDEYSEVVGGDLQVGDKIILNPPAMFTQQGPPAFVGS